MTTKQRFNIALPIDIAKLVEHKVGSGAYASPSDVMHDGLCALMERDATIDRWLREDVIAGHAEYLADPSTGVPADQILDRIKARRSTPSSE